MCVLGLGLYCRAMIETVPTRHSSSHADLARTDRRKRVATFLCEWPRREGDRDALGGTPPIPTSSYAPAPCRSPQRHPPHERVPVARRQAVCAAAPSPSAGQLGDVLRPPPINSRPRGTQTGFAAMRRATGSAARRNPSTSCACNPALIRDARIAARLSPLLIASGMPAMRERVVLVPIDARCIVQHVPARVLRLRAIGTDREERLQLTHSDQPHSPCHFFLSAAAAAIFASLSSSSFIIKLCCRSWNLQRQKTKLHTPSIITIWKMIVPYSCQVQSSNLSAAP